MEECWDGLHGNGKMEAGDALGEEGPDESTLVDCDMGLCVPEVSASPTLLEGPHKSAKEAYDEAQEPEYIDPDSRGRRFPVCNTRLEEGRVVDEGPGVREAIQLL